MHGHVTLISCSPEAAAIIASGGRISTMDGTADEIYAKSLAAGQEKNEKLIGKGALLRAHVGAGTLLCKLILRERLRPRRAVPDRIPAGVLHGQIPPLRRFFRRGLCLRRTFPTRRRRRPSTRPSRALFGIYDELEAAGVPKEDARFVLPYCFCSNFFCSMNARELVHVMNELTYGRGSGIPELRALGESLFAQCEARLPFLALRKPEVYRRTPDWTPQAGAAARPGRTRHCIVRRAGCRAEDLRCVSARARPGPAAAAGGRADRASEDAPCPAPPPGSWNRRVIRCSSAASRSPRSRT